MPSLLPGSFQITNALRSGKFCFSGCELGLGYANFNDTDPMLSKKIRSCHSILRSTSLYLCFEEYCKDEGREEWLWGANETCRVVADVSMVSYDLIANYAPDDIARIRRLKGEEALSYPSLNEVVIPDEAFFERAFTTLV